MANLNVEVTSDTRPAKRLSTTLLRATPLADQGSGLSVPSRRTHVPRPSGAASTCRPGSHLLDLQDAWQLYGVTRGGVEARRAPTACELVLTGGDTDLRVFVAWTGYWVAEWRWGRLLWLACWFTALLRCVCAAANGGEHPPQVVAPAPGDHGRAALSACPAPQQPRSKQCLPIEMAVMSTARTS